MRSRRAGVSGSATAGLGDASILGGEIFVSGFSDDDMTALALDPGDRAAALLWIQPLPLPESAVLSQ